MSPFYLSIEWWEIAGDGGKWRAVNGLQIPVAASYPAIRSEFRNLGHKVPTPPHIFSA